MRFVNTCALKEGSLSDSLGTSLSALCSLSLTPWGINNRIWRIMVIGWWKSFLPGVLPQLIKCDTEDFTVGGLWQISNLLYIK